MITGMRDVDSASSIRYAQVVITESGGLYWNKDDGGVLGAWLQAVSLTGAQTLTDKTLTDVAALTTTGEADFGDNIRFSGTNSVALPAITHASDTNTGIYFDASDGMALTNAGLATLTTDSNNNSLFSGNLATNKFLVPGAGGELTIASGAVTLTGSYHTIDTEGDASTDDLVTLAGAVDGAIIYLSAADDARTVVVKDGTGNIFLAGGDFSLDSIQDILTLKFDSASGQYREVSRSNNA